MRMGAYDRAYAPDVCMYIIKRNVSFSSYFYA